jgi:hypothetical protein
MHVCDKSFKRLLKTGLYILTVFGMSAGSTSGQTGDRTAAFAFTERMGTGNNLMAQKVNAGFAAQEDFALLKQHHFEHCRIGAKLDENTGAGPNYTIDAASMAEFKQAVDWCIAEGLVAIVDPVHNWANHDTNPYTSADLPKLQKIWEQVAAEFATYPLDTVCFEIMNEPHTGYSLADIINNNLAIIRGTTGNEQRIVIVSGQGFTTRQALINALDGDIIPANDDYLIGTYHYYDPKTFTKSSDPDYNPVWGAEAEFDLVASVFDAVVTANDNWASRNSTTTIPILLGEYGVDNAAPSSERLRWLSWIRLMAEERGFATSHWNMYNDAAASKGMGPWTTAEKNDPSLRYFHADVVEVMLMRYEAEDGILSGGVAVDTTVPGYTGTGYVTYPASVGPTVYVSVDSMYIPRDDAYTVKVAYASDVDRDVTIQTWDDLGGLVESKTVTLPSTGSFSTWAVAEVDVAFAAGTAGQFQVIADTVQGPNIDWIDVTKTPAPPVAGYNRFDVVADVSAKESQPTTNQGTKTFLEVREDLNHAFARYAYLKFNVSALVGTITNATLHVYSDTELDTVDLWAVSDTTWTETGLTWNNRPALGSLLGNAQASPGTWFSYDVTSQITGDATYAFCLNETGNTYHKLGSKEGGFGAYLEVLTEAAGGGNNAPTFNSKLSGTPGAVDVGLNNWTVQVSDGTDTDSATLQITVDAAPVNQPPAFTVDPINEINATENAAYSSTIADDASDPESDPMTFSKVSGPAWLSVASDGSLSGTPGAGDVGANVFTVQVTATGGSDTATLNITVDAAPVNQPPAFNADPFSKPDAEERKNYSSSIANDATDPDADPLTFSKISGPAWLNVAANGALSGRPKRNDVGLNTFVVQVSDGSLTDQATMTINVID